MTTYPTAPRKKSDKDEKLRRIETIWAWIAKGYTNAQIRATIMKEWGINTRQAYYYVSQAADYAKTEINRNVELSFSFHIETRKEMLRQLFKQKDELLQLRAEKQLSFKEFNRQMLDIHDQLLKTLADMAKIEGIYAPTKTDITSQGQPITQVYRLPDGTEIEF